MGGLDFDRGHGSAGSGDGLLGLPERLAGTFGLAAVGGVAMQAAIHRFGDLALRGAKGAQIGLVAGIELADFGLQPVQLFQLGIKGGCTLAG